MFNKKDYSYHLPEGLIAAEAVHPHHDAKLMVVDRHSGAITAESTFWHLGQFLGENRVLFFNDSRVIRARIKLEDVPYETLSGEKKVLREGEIFYLRSLEKNQCEVLVRPGNKFKIGTRWYIGEYILHVIGMTDVGRIIEITSGKKEKDASSVIGEFLEKYGSLPLPPYIEYLPEKEADYQTTFAKKDGSVAAPTASLHFTQELLDKLENEEEYVTLHVGLGTFKGIDTDDVRDYVIHRERAEVDLHIFSRIYHYAHTGKRIVAVGTTACRTLESLPAVWQNLGERIKDTIDANTRNYWDILAGKVQENNWIHHLQINEGESILSFETEIYIVPGHEFLVVEDLITNFHLPESSLIVLVSAFIGQKEALSLYEYAIKKQYRFFSFGDGMYLRGN